MTVVSAVSAVVHTLHPGDLAFATQGERLDTLLGSCVAIVLTDPRRTVGVMCHIVHARPASGARPPSTAYAGVALAGMYQLLRAHSIAPKLCEAYVYGGGNMFPDLVQATSVGDDNARWALNALAADGIPVLAHDLGGAVYRRLRWTVGHAAPQVSAVAI
ncbi:chemotaxis protein CheD [Rubrivivax gelatinosus]|uniref:Chemotaxis protein CheD n=1 Tax=Rubrivivax gelatinosus TaxID=28068 RepID=A0ABS1DTZ6_RUBGE|nr:chemotaxis protein CheD [Rubrivivax gelatinosus]MBK1713517.1 hypothetical protein [Rubrivivax gelatinosus]